MLLALYGMLLAPASGAAQIVACLLLLGIYYAATEGVLMALASTQLPPGVRGTGLSVLVTRHEPRAAGVGDRVRRAVGRRAGPAPRWPSSPRRSR